MTLTPTQTALRERLRAARLADMAATAHTAPARPVSDDTLRLLGRTDPARAAGVIDDEDQAILCMTLPDICAELLAHRHAARRRAAHAIKRDSAT